MEQPCRHDGRISVTGEPARVNYHAECLECGQLATFPQAPLDDLSAAAWDVRVFAEARRALKAEARRGEGRFPGKTAPVRARNALTALYLELSPDIAADVRTHVEEAFAEIATEAAREALEQAAQVVEAFDDDARDRRLLLAAERIRALPPASPASPAPPEPGMLLKCLVCALDKPWGVWDSTTGVAVCIECRDAARAPKPGAVERAPCGCVLVRVAVTECSEPCTTHAATPAAPASPGAGVGDDRRDRCELCALGAPRRGAIHYGSQSFGMIPDTPCDADPDSRAARRGEGGA